MTSHFLRVRRSRLLPLEEFYVVRVNLWGKGAFLQFFLVVEVFLALQELVFLLLFLVESLVQL